MYIANVNYVMHYDAYIFVYLFISVALQIYLKICSNTIKVYLSWEVILILRYILSFLKKNMFEQTGSDSIFRQILQNTDRQPQGLK